MRGDQAVKVASIDLTQQIKRLLVRQVTEISTNTLLQHIRIWTIRQHVHVIVKLQQQRVQTTECVDDVTGNMAGIGQDAAYLGKGVYPVDPEWAGSVDRFSIYNKALSDAEVLYLAIH